MAVDFFVAGRWRNRDAIVAALRLLDQAGFSSYCFVRNDYAGVLSELGDGRDPSDLAATMEAVALDDLRIKAVFDTDLAAQRAAKRFLVVLPAGAAAHIEAGVAYGLGQPCYAIGPVEKTETLYRIFDRMFADGTELAQWLEAEAMSR